LEDMNEYDLIKLGGAMTRLWNDKGVSAAFAKSHIFGVSDSIGYLMDRLPAIFNPNYVPTDQDIIHCRVQTTGVVSIEFNYSGLTFEIFDVGGQRSERKKWIHCFENVYAVLFVAALSDYDLAMNEDPDKNRMDDSLGLFDQICNNRWFEECSLILFLNKKDVFREKIRRVPISRCFPEYKGKPNYEESSNFIRQQFEGQNKSKKDIFSHFTCATDSQSVKFIFDAVMTNLIMSNLKNVGLQ
jgi:G-protein alpha subunit.